VTSDFPSPMLAAYVLFGAIVLSFVLSHVNQRFSSPVIAIFNRWLRWGIFSLGAAKICSDFELIDRPLWVLITSFFLIYFLIETSYRWLEIHALSVSPIPLFPRFQVNASGEEWRHLPANLGLSGQSGTTAHPNHVPAAGQWRYLGVLHAVVANRVRLSLPHR
jgi:hypothetical protein